MSWLELRSIRALRGPNIWARVPVLEANLRVSADVPTPAEPEPDFRARVLASLSALGDPFGNSAGPIRERCAVAWRSILQRLESPAVGGTGRGLLLADLLVQLTLTLETMAGSEVAFGRVAAPLESSLPSLIIEFEEEPLARDCLAVARDLCDAAVQRQPFDLTAQIRRLREVGDQVCLGPSTRAIVLAARQRSIPYCRLSAGSLVQLGQGIHQHRIWAAETDRTSAIGETIAGDKELTKRLLRAVGVPVPEGRLVADAEDAWRATCELGGPVVVKPLNGNHGRAVFIGLTKREEITPAYELACTEGDGVIVERAISGAEHRLLIVGPQLVAAIRGDPVYVVGDGVRSIAELMEELNRDPRRGQDADCPLAQLEFDSANRAMLAHQGYQPDSVPAAEVRVLLQRNGNLAIDVTDQVHPDNGALAVLAARTVGLDIAGVDLVADDIAVPLRQQRGAVVEVNAGPGLQMHLQPGEGIPRPVGEKIIASLFPANTKGRIPIVAVQPGPRAASLARLVGHLLRRAGMYVGVACAEGVFVDRQQLGVRNATDARSAADLLLHPWIAAAVFETSEVSILEEGLGFDLCQVAVLTGSDWAEAVGAAADRISAVRQALLHAVADSGTLVVPADALNAARTAAAERTNLIPFSAAADHPAVAAHREQAGRAVFLRDDQLVLAHGRREEAVRIGQGAAAPGDREVVLAASAAAWALGLWAGALQQGLDAVLLQRDSGT